MSYDPDRIAKDYEPKHEKEVPPFKTAVADFLALLVARRAASYDPDKTSI